MNIRIFVNRLANILFAGILGTLVGLACAADDYPTRPIRFVVPYPPGGTTDVLGRGMGQKLSERLKQPVLIDNKPGGNTLIGAQAALAAPADGYTLMYIGGSSTTTVFNKTVSFDLLKDFIPVVSLYQGPYMLFVPASLPVKDYKEFIAYAKANPGKLNYGSAAPSAMLSMEAFKARAGINLVHIPYKGSNPTTTALLSNEIQAAFDSAITYAAHVKSGKLKAIGVGGPRATALLPDVPLITDTFPGFATLFNGGLWAKTGTPKDIVDKLNREMNIIIQMPDIQALVASTGAYTPGGSSDDFRHIIESELEFYGNAAKMSGYKPE